MNNVNQMNPMMNQMNSNLNFMKPRTQIYQNDINIIIKKEKEKAEKLDHTNQKLKSIFGDDEEDEEDLFSKSKSSRKT